MAYYAPVQNYRSNFGSAIAQGMGQVATGMQRGQDLAEAERLRQEENARRDRERQQQLAMAGFKSIEDAMETYTPPPEQAVLPAQQAPVAAPQAVVGEDGLPTVGAIQGASMVSPLQGQQAIAAPFSAAPQQRMREGYTDIGAGLAMNPASSPEAIRAAFLQEQADERERAQLAEREAHIMGLLGDDPMAAQRAAMAARGYDAGTLFGAITPEQRRDESVADFEAMEEAGWPWYQKKARFDASLRAAELARRGGGAGGGGAGGMTGNKEFEVNSTAARGHATRAIMNGWRQEDARDFLYQQYGNSLPQGYIDGIVAEFYDRGPNNITAADAEQRADRDITAALDRTKGGRGTVLHPVTGETVNVGSMPAGELLRFQQEYARSLYDPSGGPLPTERALGWGQEEAEEPTAFRMPDLDMDLNLGYRTPAWRRGIQGAMGEEAPASPAAPQTPARPTSSTGGRSDRASEIARGTGRVRNVSTGRGLTGYAPREELQAERAAVQQAIQMLQGRNDQESVARRAGAERYLRDIEGALAHHERVRSPGPIQSAAR